MYSTKALIGALLFAVLGVSYTDGVSKIFNGLREVGEGQYPFLGWILIGIKRVKCGAVLVAPDAALTAASCAGADIVSVSFGDHGRLTATGFEQTFTVAQTILHPNYTASTFEYDVAILELDSNIIETAQVAPIPLLADDDLKARILSKHMRVAGWGYEVGGSTDLVRDQSDVPYEYTADAATCTNSSAPMSTGTCYVPFRDPTAVTCEGDVGGPVIVNKRRVYTLAGVMSGWNVGQGCQAGERLATTIPTVYDWAMATLASL